MKVLGMLSFVLLMIGGLNWGLIGFFEYDLVNALLGAWPMVVRGVYGLVGLSVVFAFFGHFFCKGKMCCK